jgi:hypothetical protein
MNVLILTPDRVGSTLLQRLITVYANINENGRPLSINLHELTNGLTKYHSIQFNQEILGKKYDGWGYHQSLTEIVSMIDSVDHDVISRLAHYHIKNRKDQIADQLGFYQYLNENFYIISARRKNLFEHAMSWCISSEAKKLNVYNFDEKYNTYQRILKNGLNVQTESIEKYLNQYHDYLDWVDRHFHVNSYFEYERDLPDIENYILNLSVFSDCAQTQNWFDHFGITWKNWNRMHYLLSLVPFQYHFSDEEKSFIKDNIDLYSYTRVKIQDLQDSGILVSGIPIKLHTLKEKAELITNMSQCLKHYNHWIGVNRPNYALSYKSETLTQTALLEHSQWSTAHGNIVSQLTSDDISNQKLLISDLRLS